MIKYVRIEKHATPTNLVNTTYQQIKRDFGFLAEPFTLHTPAPPLLAASWILVREITLVGKTNRKIKEVVATAVSEANRCPYCVDAHNIMFRATGGATARLLPLHPDPNIKAAYQWGLATRTPTTEIIQIPPFRVEDVSEIFGTALAFHYINRMVSVFLDLTPLPIRYRWLKTTQQQMVALWLGHIVKRSKAAGESLSLITECAIPINLEWLDVSSNTAAAIGRWVSAVEQAGKKALTSSARECITRYLQNWQGEDLPLGVGWLDEATLGLQGEDRAGARFGLMVALCPYRITERQINDYRVYQPGDEALIGAAAWGSMQAALKIATWWHCP